MRLVLPLLLTTACLFPASAAFLTQQSTCSFVSRRESSFQCSSSRYHQEEEEEEDEDDDEIDADSLGDWRAFRRNLAGMTNADEHEPRVAKISTENEKVLRTQNQVLANEYKTGAWAHETSMVCIHLLEYVVCLFWAPLSHSLTLSLSLSLSRDTLA
jgi:hypothetical protein